MVARKTKRVALVTAVSASLMMAGAAAFATNDPPPPCPRGNGIGQGQGMGTGNDNPRGNGYANGWIHKRCHQDNGGGNPNPPNGGGGGNPNPNGGGGGDDGIGADVSVHVDLPDVDLPDVLPDGGLMVDTALGQVKTAAEQARMLADDDVANLIEIVQAAGDGAPSLASGSTAQAGVSVSGTSGSGTVNVSSGAVGGATTLSSGLTSSTLNLLNSNMEGAKAIVFGTMVSML